jgi:K+-sensing histidine kinase KdpD
LKFLFFCFVVAFVICFNDSKTVSLCFFFVAIVDARIEAEAEHVRSSLLSSVSHDLRTPLASIAGASSSLLEAPGLDETTRRQLLETVADEAARLNRLLENILQMSKLDAGGAAITRHHRAT